MCGITGIYRGSRGLTDEDKSALPRMTDVLAHRGPDDAGIHLENDVGLGHRRLSIIDLSGGKQPMCNEDGSVWIAFNGEIFNYIELMDVLKKKGHVFRTRSDTETIVHAYEQFGESFLDHLNGQFAIALWDRRLKRLLLARDRVGIRPLYYAELGKGLVFGSEVKALFRHPELRPEMDPGGLQQVLTVWANIPPRTVFKGVRELAPGHLLTVGPEGVAVKRYWRLSFPEENGYDDRGIDYYRKRLGELLFDAVTLRLRADVPVASYLSGGIDSSVIAALVKKYHNNDLVTFSVAFADEQFDERPYQWQMVDHLGTDHRMVEATYESIGHAFTDVVWYAEKPMIRTAPGPLYILSRLVRNNGIKVVLTGEGADEVFAGYNIFKEDRIRRFWARQPDSRLRPSLISRIYPNIKRSTTTDSFWQHFFRKDLADTGSPYYSHKIRWHNTGQIRRYLMPELQSQFDEDRDIMQPLAEYLDPDLMRWHPLCRAQYLETMIFMSGYLLSSQGDRMMMGNAVEGRFPFLDHRIIEFAATVPPRYKLNILREKHLLKETFGDLVPQDILARAKQPYRAPINQCFSGMLDNLGTRVFGEEAVKKSGYFDPRAARMLKTKMERSAGVLSERENMAVVGIVSTQLLHHHFVDSFEDSVMANELKFSSNRESPSDQTKGKANVSTDTHSTLPS